MLAELREKYRCEFKEEHVLQIEEMERSLLWMSRFNSDDAATLGATIVSCSKMYEEDISVRIIRMSDLLTIFQYVGDSKSQRNLDFGMSKYQTVIKTGHCSLWSLAEDAVYRNQDQIFCEDSGCLPVGGAFPIYIDETLTAVITTSGLHHGKDYEVVVRALCLMQNKNMPLYTGTMI